MGPHDASLIGLPWSFARVLSQIA